MADDSKQGERLRVVIIGAGPCGLGAAWRLHELAEQGNQQATNIDWVLLDESPAAGGLASSIVDEQGFTWDLGGHVVFFTLQIFYRVVGFAQRPMESNGARGVGMDAGSIHSLSFSKQHLALTPERTLGLFGWPH